MQGWRHGLVDRRLGVDRQLLLCQCACIEDWIDMEHRNISTVLALLHCGKMAVWRTLYEDRNCGFNGAQTAALLGRSNRPVRGRAN